MSAEQEGCLYVPDGSRLREFAEAIAWLWRLGPLLEEPRSDAVGVGWLGDQEELIGRAGDGSLCGAAIFAVRPGPEEGKMPSRARVAGVAGFGPGESVTGQFPVLHGGTSAVSSSLGVHATRDGSVMVLAADPDATWGALDGYWVLPALAGFLAELLDRPLVMIPPVGWVRYDDAPGTAHHQLAGNAPSDAKMVRRFEALHKRYGEVGALINLALSSRALIDGEEVPLDAVWPRAVETIAGGVEAGVFEPVCHGYLHLDSEELAAGRLEPREFANTNEEEAGRRVDASLDWIEAATGQRPATFVAPNWAYGEGLLAALRARSLPAWLPPRPGPLLDGENMRETLFSTLEGLHRLDYTPIGKLAAAGMPGTIVAHGGLFDQRANRLKHLNQLPTAARLAYRRDLLRVPWTEGIRWIGAEELMGRIRAHDQVHVDGDRVIADGGFDVVALDGNGRRTVHT